MNTKFTLTLTAVLGIVFTSVNHAAVTNVVLVHGAFADVAALIEKAAKAAP